MATSGTGTRGTSDVTPPLTGSLYLRGTLTVCGSSAKDGSAGNMVQSPKGLCVYAPCKH